MIHEGDERPVGAVLIAGPTASGKSALALNLAESANGTIINTDSMQVYRDLAVLTARPAGGDLARAPHVLYGHVDGARNHSVGRWLADVDTAIAAVDRAQRLPIFVGGTGLYFRALEGGLVEIPAIPEEIRAEARARAATEALGTLHAALHPDDAARLRPSDSQRIQRALEVFRATGRSLLSWQSAPHGPSRLAGRRVLRLFLEPERPAVHAAINSRFDGMIAAGALEEVRALVARGLDTSLPVMRAHGVPWLAQALAGTLPLAAAIERSKSDTRHYAKRQVTWFRHQMPDFAFIGPADAAARLPLLLRCG